MRSEPSLNLVRYCGNVSNETADGSGLTCPANCSTALEDAKRRLGCCFNAVFNTTYLRPSYSFTDSWIWDICNVSLPIVCNKNSSTNGSPGPWLAVLVLASVVTTYV